MENPESKIEVQNRFPLFHIEDNKNGNFGNIYQQVSTTIGNGVNSTILLK